MHVVAPMTPRTARPSRTSESEPAGAALTQVLLHLFQLRKLVGIEDGLDRVEGRFVLRLEGLVSIPHGDCRLAHRNHVGAVRFERLVEGLLGFTGCLHQRLGRGALLLKDRLPLSLLVVGEAEVTSDHLQGRTTGTSMPEAGTSRTVMPHLSRGTSGTKRMTPMSALGALCGGQRNESKGRNREYGNFECRLFHFLFLNLSCFLE